LPRDVPVRAVPGGSRRAKRNFWSANFWSTSFWSTSFWSSNFWSAYCWFTQYYSTPV